MAISRTQILKDLLPVLNNVFDQEYRKRLILHDWRETPVKDVDTETLRNLWLVRWGKRAVLMSDVAEHCDEGVVQVMQELANRGLVSEQANSRFDTAETEYYYVLGKTNEPEHHI